MSNSRMIEAALTVARSRVIAKSHKHDKLRAMDGVGIIVSSLQVSNKIEFMPESKTFIVNANHRMTSIQVVEALEKGLTAIIAGQEPAPVL